VKKVVVVNNVTGETFKGVFPDIESARNWIEKCVTHNSWGKPDRWETQTDGTHEHSREILGETGSYMEYFFPCEYTVDISDNTEEYNIEKEIDDAVSYEKKIEDACLDCLRFCRYFLKVNELTLQQKKTLKSDFSDVISYLKDGDADNAKLSIEMIEKPAYNLLKARLLKIIEKVVI